tara:strand:+ start:2056 stop:2286 length:231 start_codon:yes stop_codon:yes gene_type:complete
MCKHNITNKKDFLQWALKGGHPNKGGTTKTFAMLSNCNDMKYYCPNFSFVKTTKRKSPVRKPKSPVSRPKKSSVKK